MKRTCDNPSLPYTPTQLREVLRTEGEYELVYSNLASESRAPLFDAGSRGIVVNGRLWRYAYAQLRRSSSS